MDSETQQTSATSRLARSIVNIKKMFRSRRRKKKDHFDPDKPCYLLNLMVEPSLFEMIFNYLDVRSLTRVESCCSILREVVVQNNIYKRRWRRVCLKRGEEKKMKEKKVVLDKDLSQIENSRQFKKKLCEDYYRKQKGKATSQQLKFKQYTPDCASCMMVETGEKTSHPGWPCDSCGRYPRTIGGY